MQPRSWLGQEADFRAVLLGAATTTTGSRGPSEFTNNSGWTGTLYRDARFPIYPACRERKTPISIRKEP